MCTKEKKHGKCERSILGRDWEFRNDFSEKVMRAEKRKTTSVHGEKGGALQLAGKPRDRREYSVV